MVLRENAIKYNIMNADTFKEMLQIIEDWNKGAREENRTYKVSIYCGAQCHVCTPWDILDYCTGEGEWEEGDLVGYNTGKELCLIDLDSITAIKINMYENEE